MKYDKHVAISVASEVAKRVRYVLYVPLEMRDSSSPAPPLNSLIQGVCTISSFQELFCCFFEAPAHHDHHSTAKSVGLLFQVSFGIPKFGFFTVWGSK